MGRDRRRNLAGTLLCPLFAIQDIGAGDLMVAATHEAQLNVVLHVFNMKSTTAGARAHQGTGDLVGQRLYRFAHAGRRRSLGSVNRKKSLHQSNSNFVGLKRYNCAIAPDDLVMRQRTLRACRSRAQGGCESRSGAAHGNGCRRCSEHKTRFL